jgi:hypothetical protein
MHCAVLYVYLFFSIFPFQSPLLPVYLPYTWGDKSTKPSFRLE